MKNTLPMVFRWLCTVKCLVLFLAAAFGATMLPGQNLYWAVTNGTWDTVSANWSGAAAVYADGDTVNFTNTAGGTVTAVAGGIAPGAVTNSAASGTYTLTGGAIGGTGTLTKVGAGSLVLAGLNTYTGGTTISGGTLAIGTNSANSGTVVTGGATGVGNVTLAGGVTLGESGTSITWYVPTLTLQGNITLTGNSRQTVAFGTLNLFGGNTTLTLGATGGNIVQTVTGYTVSGGEGTGRSRWEIGNTLGSLTVQNGTLDLETSLTGSSYAGFMFNGGNTSFTNNGGLIVGPNVLLQTGSTANTLGTTTGSTPAMTVNGIWDLNGGAAGASQTVYCLAGSGQVNNAMLAADTASKTLTINGTAGSTTFAGSLNDGAGTGKLSLSKTGGSTQILSGANTYSGGTTVGGGTLTLASSGSLNFIIGTNGVNNQISGAGAVNLDGTFYFNLAGASTNAGNYWTIVNVGTLTVNFGGTFNVVGFANIGGGLWTTTQNGTTYQFRTTTGALSVPAGQMLSNNLYWAVTNGIWDTVTANWNGGTAVFANGAAVNFTNIAGGTVTVQAGGVLPGSIAVSAASGTHAITGGAIGGTNTLTKSGAGTLVLSGPNTYTGLTTVSAGTLQLAGGSGTVLPGGSPLTLAGGTLDLNGQSDAINLLQITGNAIVTDSAGGGGLTATNKGTSQGVQSTGQLVLNSGTLISSNYFLNNGALTINGGSLQLPNELLNGFNTAGAVVTLNSGSILSELNGTLSFGNNPCSYHFNGGTVQTWSFKRRSTGNVDMYFNGVTVRPTQNNAAFLPTTPFTSGQNAWISTNGLVVNNNGFNITIGGPLQHDSSLGTVADGGLTATGTGLLTLSGANTYTGNTTVSNGNLLVNGYVPGSVVVNSGGTLGGSGVIGGGLMVVANGTLQPGLNATNGTTLTVNGSVNLAGTTQLQIGRNGSALINDQIQAGGTLTCGGTLVIVAGSGFLKAGDTFTLFNAGGINGNFANIVFPPGYTFNQTLAANGQIVVTSAPPSPGFQSVSLSGSSGGGSKTMSLTWANNYLGWLVQSNSVSLANSNDWFDITGSDGATNLSFSVNPEVTNCFYRMRSQSTADFAIDPLVTGSNGLSVDSVWSGIVIGNGLLTLANMQIACYYNSNRQMTVAARNLNSTNWYYQTLNNQFGGWDVHNYVAEQVDPAGYLHVSGNMHSAPMIYYRSTAPVTNAIQFQTPGFMAKISPLWNSAYEGSCTYPAWLTGPNGEFIFDYRSQDIGGNDIYLKYNPSTQTFSSPMGANSSLFFWTNIYSVYPNNSVQRGYFHSLYCWRNTAGDAGSNFRLCYVRSADLTNWTDAFSRPVTLPLTPNSTLPIVDDILPDHGLGNSSAQLGFDRDGVPLVAYSKYDANGHSQVYVARPNPATLTWTIVQLTTNDSWGIIFNNTATTNSTGSVGNGWMNNDPVDGLPTLDVAMTDPYGNRDPNSGFYTLDQNTLKPVDPAGKDEGTYYSASAPQAINWPVDTQGVVNNFTDVVRNATMQIDRTYSDGMGFANFFYYLRWEALPADNGYTTKYDQNGQVLNPPPEPLQLYRTAANFDAEVYGIMLKPANANVYGSMTRTIDVARVFGSSLSSPATGMANFAQWTFNVTTAGEYIMGGSTCSPLGTNGSFYIQLDNGPLIDWRVSGFWDYQPVTTGATKGVTGLVLTAGSHTLRLYAEQPGMAVEYFWLNANPGRTPALTPPSYTGFTLTPDATAVSGYALGSPYGSNPSGNTANYAIPVAKSGRYLLLGRTQAPDTNSDSFYLSINGGTPQVWTIPVSGTNWVWQAIGTNQTYNAGTLNLNVSGLQGGAKLDSFMLLQLP